MEPSQGRKHQLEKAIVKHRILYDRGEPVISDEEYDLLEQELACFDKNHPLLNKVGVAKMQGAKIGVKHNPPMLSLAKTYEPMELWKFMHTFPCIFMEKVDGIALSLTYNMQQGGVLERAQTRGNGFQGEDITHFIKHVPSIPKHIPLDFISTLSQIHWFEVRGELYFPLEDFKRFSHRFDGYRNAVAGTLGRKDLDEKALEVLQCLRVYPYDALLKDSQNVFLQGVHAFLKLNTSSHRDKLQALHALGFDNARCDFWKGELKALEVFLDEFFTKQRLYQVDGLVARIDNDAIWHQMGATAHHPRGSLAFKRVGEMQTTRMIDIQTNVGRSGKLTFKAHLEPVFLSGATLHFASLHNASFIEKGGYGPGALVRIKRSGEVIPTIMECVEKPLEPYVLPTQCPCGYALRREGPELWCTGQGPCPHKTHESVLHYCRVLDFKGLSRQILQRLIENDLVSDVLDLYELRESDLLPLPGFGSKLAHNVINAINKVTNIALEDFLFALGVDGKIRCQDVADRYGNWKDLCNATLEEITVLEGWAQKSAEKWIQSFSKIRPIADKLLEKYITLKPIEIKDSHVQKHVFSGKTICITGELNKPRSLWVRLLKEKGIAVGATVSKNTAYLIFNGNESSSSKYKKAMELGIPILSEEELERRLES